MTIKINNIYEEPSSGVNYEHISNDDLIKLTQNIAFMNGTSSAYELKAFMARNVYTDLPTLMVNGGYNKKSSDYSIDSDSEEEIENMTITVANEVGFANPNGVIISHGVGYDWADQMLGGDGLGGTLEKYNKTFSSPVTKLEYVEDGSVEDAYRFLNDELDLDELFASVISDAEELESMSETEIISNPPEKSQKNIIEDGRISPSQLEKTIELAKDAADELDIEPIFLVKKSNNMPFVVVPETLNSTDADEVDPLINNSNDGQSIQFSEYGDQRDVPDWIDSPEIELAILSKYINDDLKDIIERHGSYDDSKLVELINSVDLSVPNDFKFIFSNGDWKVSDDYIEEFARNNSDKNPQATMDYLKKINIDSSTFKMFYEDSSFMQELPNDTEFMKYLNEVDKKYGFVGEEFVTPSGRVSTLAVYDKSEINSDDMRVYLEKHGMILSNDADIVQIVDLEGNEVDSWIAYGEDGYMFPYYQAISEEEFRKETTNFVDPNLSVAEISFGSDTIKALGQAEVDKQTGAVSFQGKKQEKGR